MRDAEARARNGIITQVLTHTSYDSESENAGLQKRKLDLVYSKVFGYLG